MPAPAPQSDTQWSTRPLTSTEITAMLRSLLGVFDDPRLTSHSLKTTCLSWCAKADVSREHRRILGRHTSAVVDADSIYSRDLMYGPVVALEKVMSRKVQPGRTKESILANCTAHLSYTPKASRVPRARGGAYDSKGEHRASDPLRNLLILGTHTCKPLLPAN